MVEPCPKYNFTGEEEDEDEDEEIVITDLTERETIFWQQTYMLVLREYRIRS